MQTHPGKASFHISIHQLWQEPAFFSIMKTPEPSAANAIFFGLPGTKLIFFTHARTYQIPFKNFAGPVAQRPLYGMRSPV
jgi:hypothetical protein